VDTKIDYTVVIPIFNEEETIPELWRRLINVFKQLDGKKEVIFVNDGSTDESLKILTDLSWKYSEIKILDLSRNFGHQCAISAGIDHANGNAVVLMDGDLQDPPEVILDFVNKWEKGYDVVYAIRKNRKENYLKRLAFKLFYRIFFVLTGLKSIPLDAGIFSLIDRNVVNVLRCMPERNKYISGLRAYAGFRHTGIPVERSVRYRGKPRVTIAKLFKLAFDGIFSFSIVPLRIATFLGLIFAVLSFIIGSVGLYFKFILDREFLSWSYGLTTTFFMGGVQLIFLGIIGEYMGRIYEEVKQRPYYIIRKKIGFDK
jgi:dolichol-phosphate mannosyltransferase